jgi:hypothetical protein
MAENSTTPTTPIELLSQTPDDVLPANHHTAVASIEPDDAEPVIERDYSGISDVGYLAIIPVNK